MAPENKKARLAIVVTALVAMAISGLIVANWSAFKAGLKGEPAPAQKAAP